MRELKLTEVRIGNYYQSYDAKSEEWIYDTIGHADFYYLYGNEEALHDFCAIPISEEWLLGFGFAYKEYVAFSRLSNTNSGFTIEFEFPDDECYCYLEMIGVDIKYVHQLQNLYYALTGEELIKHKQ